MASQAVKLSRLRARLRRIAYEAQLLQDVADHESRKGELRKKTQAEVDALKQQIADAVTERQETRTTLTKLQTTEQTKRAALIVELNAAVGKEAKDVVRVKIDAVNATLQQAQKNLDQLDATLDSLRAARDEALFEERLTRDQLIAEDQERVRLRKEAQASDIAEKREALKAKGLIDDPLAEVRLANRAKIRQELERRLG
jgi:hypothetical protein